MPRTLVLGATGHIGAHVVRALLAEGHQVRAAYCSERFLSVLNGLPVERVRVDLETLEGLDAALDGCEWVFHAAGYYPTFFDRPDQAVERGIQVTRHLFEKIHKAKPTRVVFTSSAATIRRVTGRPATEEDAESWPLQAPRTLYAVVKIAMEQEAVRAWQEGLPVVIVNPTLCIGEYDAHVFSGQAVLTYAKQHVPFYIDYQLNAVYTGDVGVGHVRAAQRGRLGERYLLACRNLSLKELADLAAHAAGTRPPRWRLPYVAAAGASFATEVIGWITRTRPLLPREAVRTVQTGHLLDGSKAVREFGLPQTPIEEAVRRAVAWFKENKYLS